MEKLAKRALLVDFYGPLLTEKQRNVWDLHYQQDLSLTEIAEVEHISRQAIHDLLKRTERILTEYEDKLGLVQRFWIEREKLMEVQTLLQELTEDDFSSPTACERHRKIRAMIEDIFVNIQGV
ncbi:putative DNA-binding protein [Desulfosporosinus sp.]|uniref:putative DNA-binding protein n=1 Tax=Desulfosporosinus sp. TaxID=157907 RepID=UPI000E7F63FE|nr:putative DNA-binding protein [Desulfosporosinus sp.]MBC2721169.1 putative DNA-binding protein [Desulfosporosinus sp.]MBC2728235.1 putative DNA-binding protein [Desulfosporosinus sp.]HBV85806.1 putative DNA-binding protein [Desulfosporosinus sp.]